MTDDASNSVFLSNVPARATQDEIAQVMQRAGRIVSLRLMPSQKRSAAPNTLVGFCDFADAMSARAAVSLLAGHVFGDGTKLSLKLADRKRDRQVAAAETDDHLLALVDGSSIALRGDPIQIALSKLPLDDLYEAVEQLRILVIERPIAARQLLAANPQLRYAVCLVLQHAGRIPLQLPREAVFGPTGAERPTADTSSDAVPQPTTNAGSHAAAAKAIEELSEEELTKLLSLTDTDFATLPPAEAHHLRALQDEIRKFL